MLEGVKAFVTEPYSDGDNSLAVIMTLITEINVEASEPQKRLNPPLLKPWIL